MSEGSHTNLPSVGSSSHTRDTSVVQGQQEASCEGCCATTSICLVKFHAQGRLQAATPSPGSFPGMTRTRHSLQSQV